MKITFLGTGHGVPTAERACSSIMIEIGDAIYLFDAGCPVTDRLLALGHEITEVKAVFNTHTHSDHVAGIYHLADLCNWRYRDSEIDIYPSGAFVTPLKISLRRQQGRLTVPVSGFTQLTATLSTTTEYFA